MKILAIRGRNLASLVKFDLPLDRGALSGAGLFAITGPTGVGKSTLLDAMCLALFDKTPRLSHASSNVIAETAAKDPRSLLRRGTAEGWAEVDFRGGDGRTYRARWQVRRARGKQEGALQEQKLTLLDVAANIGIGDKKTDVLAEIRARLGLDFDQFRRSALLAQGDFAAFLTADEGTRALLLEKMTGASIYSELSKRAHQRAAEEKHVSDDLERELQLRATLPDAERDALAEAVRVLAPALAVADAKLAQLDATAAWQREAARLEERLAEAAGQKQHAEAQLTDAEPRFSLLLKLELAQGHCAVYDRACGTSQTIVEIETSLRTTAVQLAAAKTELAALDEQCAAAKDRWQGLRDSHARAAPVWEKAQQLDADLQSHGVGRARAEDALDESRRRVTQLEAARQKLADEIGVSAGERDRASSALAATAAWAPLVEAWPHWRIALEDLAALVERLRAARARTSGEVSSHFEAATRHTEIEAAAGAARKTFDEHPLAPILAERERLTRMSEVTERIVGLARELAENQATGARLASRLCNHAVEQRTAKMDGDALTVSLGQVAIALERDQRALTLFRTQQALAAHRAQLIDGEPCPLCGALEHPTLAEKEIDLGVADFAARVRELEAQHLQLFAAQRDALAIARSAAEAHARATADALALAEAWQRWETERQAALSSLPSRERELIGSSGEDALREHIAAAAAKLDSNREVAVAAEQAWRHAELALEQCAGVLALWTEIAACTESRDRQLGRLETAFVAIRDWRSQVERDPAAMIALCETRLAERAALQDTVTRAVAELARLSADTDPLDERLRLAREASVNASSVAEHLAAEERSLRAERDALLSVSVSAARRESEDAIARASAEWQDLEQRVAACRGSCSERARQMSELEDRLVAQRVTAEEAALALADAVASLGITLEQLSARLERDAGWVSAERTDLAQRVTADASAQSTWREREVALQDHERKRGPASELGEEDRPRLQAERDALASRLESERFRLRTDDEGRAARSALAPRVAAQRDQLTRWEKLDGLIGSSDGKRFRLFAQRVTLDALVTEANRHLLGLARRYRVERVPGANMDLMVIDQDMGEERRSVSSLSGGECFLVSLAMALALSSLSARETRIETLFIDEGFGSLDAHTLDVALAALDALQSTGCQVGIISHVSALNERVGARVDLVRRGGGLSTVES